MSEKMDGIRAFWDGSHLSSRYGNRFNLPVWFTEGIPSHLMLDGELWMGQGTTVENINKIVHSNTGNWGQVGYYIFDVPSSSGNYNERMQELEAVESLLPSHIHKVDNIQCRGTHHLLDFLDLIVATKGEGVMVRHPDSKYVQGMTSSLLKVKVHGFIQS
jgi:DNA ligase-1